MGSGRPPRRTSLYSPAGLAFLLTLGLLLACNSPSGASVTRLATSSDENWHGAGRLSPANQVEASNQKYDLDADGLIEINFLEQLDALRHDLDGNGFPDNPTAQDAYFAAFTQSSVDETCAQSCRGYELARDLDFRDPGSYASGTVNSDWTTGAGWLPIGAESSPYTARFEGNLLSISNLFILRDDREQESAFGVALFGFGGETAVLTEISLTNVDVFGVRMVGGLVGSNHGVVDRSYSTGIAAGSEDIGGLVGRNAGSIQASSSTVRVLGWSAVGSLAGYNDGEIRTSHARGGAAGRYAIGGLLGLNDGSVSNSFATGSIACNDDNCGGLIGNNDGDATGTYATGNVKGGGTIGGLVGRNGGTVTSSYATGRVSGASTVGGLIGWNTGRAIASYASGSVAGRFESVGGLAGRNSGDIIAGYAAGNVSGGTYVGGVAGTNDAGVLWALLSVGTVNGESGAGGLVGKNSPYFDDETVEVRDCLWDIQASGQLHDVGAGNPITDSRATTEALQTTSGYTGPYQNWQIDLDNADGDDDFDTGRDDIWDFGRTDQYPALKVDLDGDGLATWQEFGPQGRLESDSEDTGKYDIDADGLIEISNLEQLAAMALDSTGSGSPDYALVMKKYYSAFPLAGDESACNICNGYELTRSLDFEDPDSYATGVIDETLRNGTGWRPIRLGHYLSPSVFEGNGHTISNFNFNDTINSDAHSDVAGLFGVITEHSVVRNLGVLNANVTGVYSVGGLAGQNEGVIVNAHVSGQVTGVDRVGGMVGANRGVIKFSHASVETAGETAVGGLVGLNTAGSQGQEASIVSSYASGDVSGDLEVGGLVGRNEAAQIISTYATGTVSGESRIGGLVGVNAIDSNPSEITGSYATGSVSGDREVGGLAGANSDSITASYATGSVSGATVVGGLVGDNSTPWVDRWDEGGSGTVIASYATGSVTGQRMVGGLAGRNPGRFISRFWDVDTSGQTRGAGEGYLPAVSGKSTAELQSPTGFDEIYGAWNIDLDNSDGDFTLETGTGDFWDFGTSEQYPALKADVDGDSAATWQEFGYQGRDSSEVALAPTPAPSPVPDSTPTPVSRAADRLSLDADGDGLIEVSTLEELHAVRYDPDGDGIPTESGAAAYRLAFPTTAQPCDDCRGYELTRSLDFQDRASYSSGETNLLWTSGSGWLPIGLPPFESWFNATFDGNGFSITNLYINRTTNLDDPDATGLFGYTGPSAVILNLGLVDVSVTGRGSVGSLVGDNTGLIRHAHAIGEVSGTTHVGGLIGFNWGSGLSAGTSQIAHCYAETTVRGTDYVGGLIGLQYGTVYACYADGDVAGDEIVGGLIGGNSGALSATFARGRVSGREYVGGLVGYNFETIDTSYANAQVLGDAYVGGLAGDNDFDILASYSMGSVDGKRLVGGLVGTNSGTQFAPTIINSFTTSRVRGQELAGGLAGGNYGLVIDSYWNTQTTGQASGAGEDEPNFNRHISRTALDPLDRESRIVGTTTDQLQGPTDYSAIYARWNRSGMELDFSWYSSSRDLSDLWDFGTSSQYPVLKVDFNGDGEASWQEFGDQRPAPN